jgi:isoleucyl-tRNA synthetase
MLAPLIPYTADEVHANIPGATAASVHLLELQPPDPALAELLDEGSKFRKRWDLLLNIRDSGLKMLELMRQQEIIGSPLDAVLRMRFPKGAEEWTHLISIADSALMADLLIVSGVSELGDEHEHKLRALAEGREIFAVDGQFVYSAGPFVLLAGMRAAGLKCQRCWKYYDDGGDPELDPRCREILHAS